MPKQSSKSRKPKADPVEAAHDVLRHVIGLSEGHDEPTPEKNPAAVALGRLGGLKGGKARAEKLPEARRIAIARKAALARWGKRPKPKR